MTATGTILLGCDKTRGHFNPALSFARYAASFCAPAHIYFYPVKTEWEVLLKKEGFSYCGVPLDRLRGIQDMLIRLIEPLKIMVQTKPVRAIGFGGRRSFPVLLLLSFIIPTAVYEPNASFGKANLALALFAKKIFSGFPSSVIQPAWLRRIVEKKITVAGVPLQREYFQKDALSREPLKQALGISPATPVLLAFGGSSGAAFLNTAVHELITRDRKRFESVQVVHLTGASDYARVKALYKNEPQVLVKDFSGEMWKWYAVADAAVCRAGASSLAEVNYFGIPSVVIPLPAGYTHQYKNAEHFSRQNGVLCVDQRHFSYEDFKNKVFAVLFDASVREMLTANLRQIKLWNTPEVFSEVIAREMNLVN